MSCTVRNGNSIQLVITNGAAVDAFVPFGGGINSSNDEGVYASVLAKYMTGANGWNTNSADIGDNGSAPLGKSVYYAFNQKIKTRGITVTKFEVITAVDAQRQEPLATAKVPYNIQDTSVNGGSFVGVDTEITSVDLVKANGGAFVLSSFDMAFYKVLAGGTVSINIEFEENF